MAPLPQIIGSSFIELQQVDSTNNYATALVHEGLAQHGMVVFTHEQTRGRGQRNKDWISGKHDNLTFSLILQPSYSLSEAFYLSMMVALSVQQVCTKLCERPVYIKWPNDIFINDRKAGGILIENIISGAAWKWSIIGIGLNINQVDFGELQATSLKAISGKTLEPKEIAARISEELQRNLETLNKEEILAQYQSVLYKKGEKVKFKQGSRSFEGTVQNVTPNGELVVTHGIDEYFNVGDIEWIL